MELDPHTLQQILNKIYQQMRCPQCGGRVPVDFSSVQVVADNAMILQLKCEACDAYIVLQASLQGVENISTAKLPQVDTVNASTTLEVSEAELGMLTEALAQSDGSFQKLFEKYDVAQEDEVEEDQS